MGKNYKLSGLFFSLALILLSAAAAPAGDYIGSENCAMCHPDIFASWSGTTHAKSIEAGGVAGNDECLACHTTGMGSDAYEEAVSCESCHGPGSDHMNAGGGAGTINRDINEATCTKCHTPDWSAGWNYEEYLKTGVHDK